MEDYQFVNGRLKTIKGSLTTFNNQQKLQSMLKNLEDSQLVLVQCLTSLDIKNWNVTEEMLVNSLDEVNMLIDHIQQELQNVAEPAESEEQFTNTQQWKGGHLDHYGKVLALCKEWNYLLYQQGIEVYIPDMNIINNHKSKTIPQLKEMFNSSPNRPEIAVCLSFCRSINVFQQWLDEIFTSQSLDPKDEKNRCLFSLFWIIMLAKGCGRRKKLRRIIDKIPVWKEIQDDYWSIYFSYFKN